MSDFDVAHIREQGVDLIIIRLDRSFDHKSTTQQRAISVDLQACASAAGLAGTVVPVWEDGLGRMKFLAPQGFHPFFRSIDMGYVAVNINRRLTCG